MKLIILCTRNSEEQWDLQKLLGAFKTELEAREKASNLAENNPGQVSDQPKLYRNQPLTASALYTTEKGAPRWAYCKQNHRSKKMLGGDKCCREEGNFKKHGKCLHACIPGTWQYTVPQK